MSMNIPADRTKILGQPPFLKLTLEELQDWKGKWVLFFYLGEWRHAKLSRVCMAKTGKPQLHFTNIERTNKGSVTTTTNMARVKPVAVVRTFP